MPSTDWQALPCREFCNAGSRCAPGRCGNPYSKDDPRHWLGRGSEPVPGKPFGWAHMMQERAIFDHLIARGRDPRLSIRDAFLPSRLKARLERDYHRRKPKIGVRRRAVAAPRAEFTRDELLRIAERFDGANDPEGQEIAWKARELAER